MSHTTSITDIVFSDIEALNAAVAELRSKGVAITVEKGGRPRAYYTDQQGMGDAAYVLRLAASRYDVGLYHNAEKGGYEARTDLFMGDVAKVLGVTPAKGVSLERAALGKLYQTYAVHAATRQAIKKGYTVNRINAPDGTVKLVVGGM